MIEYWQDKLGVEWNSDYEVWDGFDIENEILEIESILKTNSNMKTIELLKQNINAALQNT